MTNIQNKTSGIKILCKRYYAETIGIITEDAVKKYIEEQTEESRKEDTRSTSL